MINDLCNPIQAVAEKERQEQLKQDRLKALKKLMTQEEKEEEGLIEAKVSFVVNLEVVVNCDYKIFKVDSKVNFENSRLNHGCQNETTWKDLEFEKF